MNSIVSRLQTELATAAQQIRNAVRTSIREQPVFLSAVDGDIGGLIVAFDDWCRTHRGLNCAVALSGAWVRVCVPPQEAGALSPQDLRNYSLRQFAHYFGNARADSGPAAWAVAVSTDRSVPLACAAPRALVDGLLRSGRRHGVRVKRVVPWWAEAAARCLPATGAVAAVEPAAVTIIQSIEGRVQRAWIEFSDSLQPPLREMDFDWRGAEGNKEVIQLWPDSSAMPAICDTKAVADVIRGRRPRSAGVRS